MQSFSNVRQLNIGRSSRRQLQHAKRTTGTEPRPSTVLVMLISLFLVCTQTLAAESELLKIRRADSSSLTQIFITFTEIPVYSSQQQGKRIDIILDSLLANTEPMDFEADDRVVKFLTQEKDKKTILTFFLRYEPQKVELSRSQQNTLVLEILLGNEFTKAYPELTNRLEGLTVVDRQGPDFANPYVSNPYTGNWRAFFSRYEPEIATRAPIKFTTPPFPIVDLLPDGNSSAILPAELFALSARGLWKDMIPIMLNLVNTTQDLVSKKQLALTLGEILFRAGDYQNGFRQLYLLKDSYKDEYVGIAAAYLLAQLRAEHENPYIADHQYKEIDSFIYDRFALSPFILLAQIETALATEQYDRANSLLQIDNIAFPPRLSTIKQLRLSDYWFATGAYVKAYVGYQLLEDKSILESQPYSLNGYCDTLYRQKRFREATQCFHTLSSLVGDKKYLGMISLKKAMAELHYEPAREMYVIFSRLEDTYPGTEAGLRAAVKKTDIRYLSQPSWRKSSPAIYHSLAEIADVREVVEEAALKEAIVYFELGDNEKCIELLQHFLRNHHASSLKQTAQALLIEILPKQLEGLLSESEYVDAIVLAKKNRELFQKNWIDIELLSLLAKAYYELGILNEAKKLYLYLIGTSGRDADEGYYLPLITILSAQGNHELVEDFVTQYKYNYPEGSDKEEISFIHLQSLIANGRDEDALALLSEPLPDTLQTRELAAMLYFNTDQFGNVIEVLTPPWTSGSLQSDDSRYILAESLFRESRYQESEQLFQDLRTLEKFHDQSNYRLAMIARDEDSQEKSLKLLEEIVEKGYDPLWKKLAEKELQYHEMNRQY